jgi:hypothetical protein
LATSQDGKSLVQFPPTQGYPESVQIQLQLPKGVSVGDTINLKLLSPAPDLSFQFGNLAVSVPPGDVELSPVAQLLGNILPSEDQNPTEANTIKGSQALLQNPTADSKQIANELPNHLQHAIQLSGAFYESHLKEWVNGRRTLEQVRQEPQNQNLSARSPETLQPTEAAQTQFIPAQLNAQENRQFLWRGELMPGQAFEWQVKEDQSKKPSPTTSPEEKTWLTSVKFDLPKLGQVHAMISLTGSSASFRISAKNTESASILSSAQPLLTNSLEASGNKLSQFLVENDGTES